MTTRWLLVPCCASLLLVASCRREAAAPILAPPVAAPPAPSSPSSPWEQLEALDARRPVPLLPRMAAHQKEQMRGHLEATQEVIAALAVDDFAAAERASAKMGYSDRMGAMCDHMGAGAPGFTPTAIQFHRSADAISAAAHRRDRREALGALAATLATCTGCHQTYRQQVVDATAWSSLTASPKAME